MRKQKQKRALSKKNAVAFAKYTVQGTIAISHLFFGFESVYIRKLFYPSSLRKIVMHRFLFSFAICLP